MGRAARLTYKCIASEILKRDDNRVTVLGLELNDGSGDIVMARADAATGRLLVSSSGAGSGTVTSVSVVSANGFAGTVATATTTPAITLSTTITGILSGNGTAISAATTTGSGSVVLATSPTLVTPLLGTPTSGTLTNCTGLPISTGVSGLGAGVATFLATPSSANLAAAVTDETGSGLLVFGTTPTIATPVLNGTVTGTGVSQSSSTLTLVQRDGNSNAFANNFIANSSSTVSAGGTTVLTSASARLQILTGAANQTYTLPNATTMNLGATFEFNNNSTGTLTVNDNAAGLVTSIASGGYARIVCTNTGSAAGTWDKHFLIPANGVWTTAGATVTGTLQATGHVTFEGVTSTGATGTGKLVFDGSPTLVTPALGVATATSINKVAITAPATSATLTIADGKTLTANNTLTLAAVDGKTLTVNKTLTLDGTDSTTMTFPTTSATIARTDAANTFTGVQSMTSPDITTSLTTPSTTFSLVNATATTVNFAGAATTMAVGASTALVTVAGNIINTSNAITASGNAATVPITHRISTVTNNSAATLTITMTTTSAVDGQMVMVRILDATAVAQTITWVNTENSTVTAPTTSNGSTTLPLTVGFQYNNATSKWRCIASA